MSSSNTLGIAAGTFALVAGANYALVWWGLAPYPYCWGAALAHASGLVGLYHAVGFTLAVISLGVMATQGLKASLKWLLLMAVVIMLPEWLDQGMRLGRTC